MLARFVGLAACPALDLDARVNLEAVAAVGIDPLDGSAPLPELRGVVLLGVNRAAGRAGRRGVGNGVLEGVGRDAENREGPVEGRLVGVVNPDAVTVEIAVGGQRD